MARSGVLGTLLLVFLVTPLAFVAVACSRSPEQRFLGQYFRASRARDNTTVALMSAVEFDPRERGVVRDFTITNVTPETRTPLGLKQLVDAAQQARTAEAEFSKRKVAYQNEHLEDIERVLKLEQTPDARVPSSLTDIKAEWDKWRNETSEVARATSEARQALLNATGPAEASLNQPGQPGLDPAQFEGDLIAKTVTIDAEVEDPQGASSQKPFRITMQRVEGTLAGETREGRWVIVAIDDGA